MASSGRASVMIAVVVLILGLVVQQMEAKSCCKTTFARNCYNTCRLPCKVSGQYCPPRSVCAGGCNCIIIDGTRCPRDYPKSMLQEASSSDAVSTDYCKLGCVSSACDAMSIISGEGEAKQAVEHCKNACSDLCNNKAASNDNIALA